MAAAGWVLALAGAILAATVALPSSRTTAAATATAASSATPLPDTGSSSSTSSSSQLDCGTVTSLLASCGDFVWHGAAASPLPSPGTPCCAGVSELYAAAADSADNWRSVCGCMAALVRRHVSNASAIALLPVLCGVLPAGRAVDNLTYCRTLLDDVRSSSHGRPGVCSSGSHIQGRPADSDVVMYTNKRNKLGV
ncbi:hypothetical protein ACP70R_022933 [Stipagrostis hirtigluma subsp. patula]